MMAMDPLEVRYAAERVTAQSHLLHAELAEALTPATNRATQAFQAFGVILDDLARRMPELRLAEFVEKRERRLASRYWRSYVARGRRMR